MTNFNCFDKQELNDFNKGHNDRYQNSRKEMKKRVKHIRDIRQAKDKTKWK